MKNILYIICFVTSMVCSSQTTIMMTTNTDQNVTGIKTFPSGTIFSGNFIVSGGSSDNVLGGNGTPYSFQTKMLSTAITGFSASAGTISATDTFLQAINKIVGNQIGMQTTISGLPTTYASIANTPINLTSSAGTLSMSTSTKNIRFEHTGTGSAWTESAASGFNEYERTIVNKGSGDVVITSGTNNFWKNGATSTTLTVRAGQVMSYYSDGTNWIVAEYIGSYQVVNTSMNSSQTAATLNSSYPNAPVMFRVYAPNVGSGMQYVKTSTGGQWMAVITNTLN